MYKYWPLLILSVFINACASTDSADSKSGGSSSYVYIPELDSGSRAHGAAFTADAMHFRQPIPDRSGWKPLEFYFKHCTEIGEESYFSKTSYDCTGPY